MFKLYLAQITLIQGQKSLEAVRQQQDVHSIIANDNQASKAANKSSITALPASSTPLSSLRTDHVKFIADTNRIQYIIDTSANRIVVNDANLLSDITISNTAIKGVGGTNVRITGKGT